MNNTIDKDTSENLDIGYLNLFRCFRFSSLVGDTKRESGKHFARYIGQIFHQISEISIYFIFVFSDFAYSLIVVFLFVPFYIIELKVHKDLR